MNQFSAEYSPQEIHMWFERMQYHDSTESSIVIAVPSSFVQDQIEQRYARAIEDRLLEISGSPIKLEFHVQRAASSPRAQRSSAQLVREEQQEASASQESSRSAPRLSVTTAVKRPHPSLNQRYTFDNFVIGENNNFAANAALAISKNPGTAYNPCLVYGGVGLGKTHLIQSIGNTVYQDIDNAKIIFVSAEEFTNDFLNALREKQTAQFKNKYRYADVLLIDDIHFLQGKEETQEELFHTFNALYEANKQMVFTCDRPVSELRQLKDRLRNRFERGLNVDLKPPSFETRLAILQKKLEQSNRNIPESVLNLICSNVTTNVRDLEKALTRILAYAELVGKDITEEVARQQLKDIFVTHHQASINIDFIQRAVADYFNLTTNELKSKKRTAAIAFPRQVAMYIARQITELSTTEVGLEFGGRDHTTVMYACQKIENKMKSDSTIEPMVKRLIRDIRESNAKG
ncbi:chromosomal replication initiator protein DnaA [Spirochaeta africana DSM 8902]|uniref:Chromosomal replication initiator protein DnaA n=2 Tax=Spirochaeta TaxID=146 RepID=H9UF18_SPIAZ|nr:chromosomal replication initiator protein DnaA [Spirochaeta africana DSM 8902]